MSDEQRAELQALCVRAADAEAKRQAAIARGDVQAVQEAECELSRLWSRYVDIEQQRAA